MQSLTAEDKKELCKDAFQDISSILAGLRDQGLSDLEIFEFGKSLIDHFDPIKMEILKKNQIIKMLCSEKLMIFRCVLILFFFLYFTYIVRSYFALLFKKI